MVSLGVLQFFFSYFDCIKVLLDISIKLWLDKIIISFFCVRSATEEQVVEECGLTGDYLITDLHPAALGLNMSEGEILNADNLYDDLNFPTYELQGEWKIIPSTANLNELRCWKCKW